MAVDIQIKPVDSGIFNVDTYVLESLNIASGGDALNAAINMANLGIKVGIIGKVGNDILGEYLVKHAEKYGVFTDRIIKSDRVSTSVCIVMIDKSGERHFAYYGKANNELSLDDIDFELVKQSKIIQIGSAMPLEKLDGNGIKEIFKKAKDFGVTTSMDVTWDSSGIWLGKIEDALYFTDIFLPSYYESKMITNKDTCEEMEDFYKKYGIKVLAIKLGADGCFVSNFKERYYIKTFDNVKVVDTTGAGDAFVSGFLTGMLKGWDIYKCGVFGNAVASHAVMEMGSTTGMKPYNEIVDFIRENGIEFKH